MALIRSGGQWFWWSGEKKNPSMNFSTGSTKELDPDPTRPNSWLLFGSPSVGLLLWCFATAKPSVRSPRPSQRTWTSSMTIWPERAPSRSSPMPMTAKALGRQENLSLRKVRRACNGGHNPTSGTAIISSRITTGMQDRPGIAVTTITNPHPRTGGNTIPTRGKGIDTRNRDSSGPQRPEIQLWYPYKKVRFLGPLTQSGFPGYTTWPQPTESLSYHSSMELARHSSHWRTFVDHQHWLWRGRLTQSASKSPRPGSLI